MDPIETISIANISVSIKTLVVQPLPVLEEIWGCFEDGLDGLKKFNARASLGLDHYHSALLTDGDGKDASQTSFDSEVFNKAEEGGYKQMDELLLVIHKAILFRLWPVTCFST